MWYEDPVCNAKIGENFYNSKYDKQSSSVEEDDWVYTSKGVKYVHKDQRLKIMPSIMRIDITITDIKAKQPNSAILNGTRIQLIINGKKTNAYARWWLFMLPQRSLDRWIWVISSSRFKVVKIYGVTLLARRMKLK